MQLYDNLSEKPSRSEKYSKKHRISKYALITLLWRQQEKCAFYTLYVLVCVNRVQLIDKKKPLDRTGKSYHILVCIGGVQLKLYLEVLGAQVYT